MTPTISGGWEGSWRGGRGNSLPPALPSTPNLILVGTVHGDPRGYDRAVRILSHFRPQLVTVEISRFSLRYRRRQGRAWQRQLARALEELPPEACRHPALQRLAAQVALPFEAAAARDWSREAGARWRPLDLGAVARRHLPRYRGELLSPGNLAALLAEAPEGPLEEWVAGEFRRARLSYETSPWRLELPDTAETLRRERLLARRLRALAGRGGRVVHLGGWEHLVPWRDGRGMWPWLEDLGPVRVLLSQADDWAAGG